MIYIPLYWLLPRPLPRSVAIEDSGIDLPDFPEDEDEAGDGSEIDPGAGLA